MDWVVWAPVAAKTAKPDRYEEGGRAVGEDGCRGGKRAGGEQEGSYRPPAVVGRNGGEGQGEHGTCDLAVI